MRTSLKTQQFLTKLGFDIILLKSPRITDKEVVTQAMEQERIVITLDLDFGEIFHFHKKGEVGIIVLRIVPPTVENVNRALKRFLSSVDMEKHNRSLIILNKRKYRIRK